MSGLCCGGYYCQYVLCVTVDMHVLAWLLLWSVCIMHVTPNNLTLTYIDNHMRYLVVTAVVHNMRLFLVQKTSRNTPKGK
jgi:hypothetical protein